MPLTREEVLKKIGEATVSGGGNNLRDGRGRLALRKFALESGFHGSRAVAEFIVVASQKKQVVSVKTGKPLDIEPNAPGTDVSIVNMLDKHASAFGNVKDLVLHLVGVEDCTQEELVSTITDLEAGAANGRVIDYDTYRKETKENKVEIVLPKWYSVEQSDE